MLLLGIDCATQAKKTGLALAQRTGDRARLLELHDPKSPDDLALQLLSWLDTSSEPALLCFDAPLGWPEALGGTLVNHQAGDALTPSPDNLFRRHTDDFVYQLLGKRSLDVGADRIARTAHAALGLLQQLRTRSGRALPMAWSPDLHESAAIEVYPAATLTAHSFRSSQYKKKEQKSERREIISALNQHLDIAEPHRERLANNDDLLDAAVCLLAGLDFLQGHAAPPPDLARAEKEGWIWVRAQR